MSGVAEMIAIIVVPGGVALLPAILQQRRGRTWLGFAAGLGVILAIQVVLQVRLRMEVLACAERACRLIADPAACRGASFGCYEWTGLAALFYLIAAGIHVIALAAGCAIAAAIRGRDRTSAASG